VQHGARALGPKAPSATTSGLKVTIIDAWRCEEFSCQILAGAALLPP